MLTTIRQSLRQPLQRTARRFASSSSSEKASEAAAKAGKAAQDAAGKAAQLASGVTDRIANAFASYRGPLIYNTRVLGHVFKQVYKAEKLAPPSSFAEIQSAYQTLFNRAKDISYWRNLYSTGEWKKVAIGGLEVYGIFKLGEIIGRRSLIGYKVE
ncbi:hypothetical protein FRB99_000286 [Tulasnella sp. 403]|nr:hypothetical protein FRB99_000286 [Tulasnella sp. 403]